MELIPSDVHNSKAEQKNKSVGIGVLPWQTPVNNAIYVNLPTLKGWSNFIRKEITVGLSCRQLDFYRCDKKISEPLPLSYLTFSALSVSICTFPSHFFSFTLPFLFCFTFFLIWQ